MIDPFRTRNAEYALRSETNPSGRNDVRHLSPALAGFVLLVAVPAHAQDATDPVAAPEPVGSDADRNRLTIGLGAANLPDYEGADDNQWFPGAVAVGRVGGFDFFTRGSQLYVDLIRDRPGPGVNFELGVIGAVRLDRTQDIRNPQVRALGELDEAYEVGGFVGVSRTGVITSDFDTLTARVAMVHDVSDVHGSYVVTPQVNYTTPLSLGTLVSVGASADYVGRGYGRTYFSVTPAQALASGLRPYAVTGSGFRRLNFQAFALQSLGGDLRRGFGIGGGVLYGRLLGDYADSPVVRDVGDRDQWSVALGVSYTF